MASVHHPDAGSHGPFGIRPETFKRVARLVGRGLGTVIALFVLFMLVAHVFGDEEGDGGATGIAVGALSLWIAASLLAGWRWERLGGVSTVASGVVLGFFVLFTAGRNEVQVARR